jgi:N-acetylmuramoyl-L-alanine amidase
MSRSTPSRPAVSILSALVEAARHVAVVVGVGMVLATVFTAWTPTSLLPAGVAQQIGEAIRISQVASNSTPVPTVAPTPAQNQPRVGLVAGHMGNDSGAVCPDGLTEAAINLDIATRVKAGLEARGLAVDLLEEFDQRLEGYQALAVVSIHNDSCAYINELATGFKVAGALEGGAPDKSARLVACLIDRYPKQTGLPYHAGSVTPDMTYNHSFYEVNTSTPIAIIETGFLNLDRKILTEEPYRVAQGVLDGILCYVMNEPVQPTLPPS